MRHQNDFEKLRNFLAPILEGDFSPPSLKAIVNKITHHSACVIPNSLFVCVPNPSEQPYLKEALAKGAHIIIGEEKLSSLLEKEKVLFIPHQDPRLALSRLSRGFFKEKPKRILAVTGTNGKTSVSYFCYSLASLAGLKSGYLGTMGFFSSENSEDVPLSSLTTPDALTLHEILEKQSFLDVLCLEASSHGLSQKRLHSVDLKGAAFTSFSQDHLDYYPTMEAYKEAKLTLFKDLLPSHGTAVVNQDLPFIDEIKALSKKRNFSFLTYSLLDSSADFFVSHYQNHSRGMSCSIRALGKEFKNVFIPLIGSVQLENILCSLGLLQSIGLSIETLVPLLERLTPVPGRLEYIGTHQGGKIFIDYAHTPDALKTVLLNLRPFTKGNLKILFGCGGNRDRLKRSLMGEMAQRFSDEVIITDDNPRYAPPALIREDILKGCPNALEIGNREEAIYEAIIHLKEGDSLVIAGKGHETGQETQGTIIPFNDKEVVKKIITEES